MSVLSTARAKIAGWFRRTEAKQRRRASVCGHATNIEDCEMIDGFKYGLNPEHFIGRSRPSHCIPCLRKKSIYCAWCGKEILVGMQVSLQKPTEGFVYTHPVTTHELGDQHTYVGCLRESCVHELPLWVGKWSKTSQVKDVERALAIDVYQS